MAFGGCAWSRDGRIIPEDSRKYSIGDTRVEAAGVDTKFLAWVTGRTVPHTILSFGTTVGKQEMNQGAFLENMAKIFT